MMQNSVIQVSIVDVSVCSSAAAFGPRLLFGSDEVCSEHVGSACDSKPNYHPPGTDVGRQLILDAPPAVCPDV